jgi:FlaA1/EpsC-like NDP-sugar epimerase
MLPDAFLLSVGLLFGHKVCAGTWLPPSAAGWHLVGPLVVGVYLIALSACGAYTTSPSRMRLSTLPILGAGLAGAWGLSLLLPSLVDPSAPPLQSTMTVHGLSAFVGLLGYRILLHRLSLSNDASSTPPPSPIRLGDLVPRDPIEIDRAPLRTFLSNQTVLVTGAGGSIGSELCAQLLTLNPFRLVLVDVSEHNLYQLETALRSRAYEGGLEFCIADVRDETVMNGLIARERPDLVLHTAAYKHVPLLERHPAEAFRNNTLATVHLLRLCEQHDVDQFVFVSTDKAVHPSSVLGATKQRAEWYVRTAPSSMRSTTVRFGNVFGSQGSVVPRFEEKLAAGDPLPVTHPDMDRYFMTSGEACTLLLQTLLLDAHPTYILQMGPPIRIQWLAEQLVEHWYPDVDPDSMIEYVGPRPGEKLSETLVAEGESVHATEHPSILGLSSSAPYSRDALESHFQHLQALCHPVHGSRERLRNLLLNTRPTTSQPAS